MNWTAFLQIAVPLLEKWVPQALESPQGQAFIADLIKLGVSALGTHVGTTVAKPPATGPNMPTSGPTGTFTS
jgi:hypothetical protein